MSNPDPSIKLESPPIDVASTEAPAEPSAGAMPLPGFNMMPPGPIPVKADVDLATVGDEQAVVVTLSTPQGLSYYFFGVDGAAMLGRALLRASRTAMAKDEPKPKLITPKKGLILP